MDQLCYLCGSSRFRAIANALAAAMTVACVVSPPVAWGESAGQADLDQAIELQLDAVKLSELTAVIELCQSALQKGLDADNAAFARNLLGGAHLQRALRRCLVVFEQSPPDPRWPRIRRDSLADLDRARELASDDGASLLLRGRLLALPAGDPEAALVALNAAIEQLEDQDRLLADALLARASLPQRNATERSSDIDEAARLAPTSPKALVARGTLRLSEGRVDDALADLTAAVGFDPTLAETHLTLARVYADRQEFAAARDSLTKAMENLPESYDLCVQAARICEQAGDPAAAIVHASAALKARPDEQELLFLRARLHAQNGDGDGAIADVSRLLELKPDDPTALRTRALFFGAMERFDEGISDLERLKRLGPNDPSVAMQLGRFHAAQGRLEKAVEQYGAVLRQEPENADARRARIEAYAALQKPREAIADCEELLVIDADDLTALNTAAWLMATSSDDSLRDGKRSLELALRACQLADFKLPHLLSTLAAAHAEAGDFNRAIEWSTKAIALADDGQRASLEAEVQSYRKQKPWREAPSADEGQR